MGTLREPYKNKHLPRLRTRFWSISLVLLTAVILGCCKAAITEEDVKAHRAWNKWDQSQKLNFLLYDEDWANLRVEYSAKDLDDENSVTFEDFYRVHEDHLEEEKIADFFQECLNAEEGEGCDFLSYVVARGVFDQNGNLYDNNEWEMRESIFLTSYEEAVKNPDITDEELRLLGMEFDADGIIVDGQDAAGEEL
mmetsp:Transcript_12857/g.25540  ORF Transcript_12857/g.25540 Transcript_12857/m.25540 type:complete len:195 (+) Transcript_12857:22-606(+)